MFFFIRYRKRKKKFNRVSSGLLNFLTKHQKMLQKILAHKMWSEIVGKLSKKTAIKAFLVEL
jgi:hypothetical protein